jgi:polyhydroxybutyrate depolymerase
MKLPATLAPLVLAALLSWLPSHIAAQDVPRRAKGEEGRRLTLTHAGRERHYVVRVPRVLTQTSDPVPVVLVLHGGGGNAANAESMTGFTRLVERERILVVYPEGTGGRPDRLLTWNAGHCCSYAMDNRVDDVGFIAALLDTLAARYPVDPARIYATGMSNGAMMAHRLGRELSHRLAAIGPVVGALFGDEPPARGPLAALSVNGLLDEAVPPNGGPTGGRSAREWDGTPTRPNLEQGTYWARANGCDPVPARAELGQVITWRYICPAGQDVEVWQIKDNGHAWPGGQRGSRLGDTASTAIVATDLLWAFFKAHPKH